MYRHCIVCSSDLGDNPLIEHCPIGRRLVFDPKRGRLWVVCRKCERWNLTPFEERWEALEECERRFRATRLRYSTDNIGLARLAPGLDLVRIGSPLRPELAAWRYGDQFGRRRRRYMVGTAVFAAGMWGAMSVASTAATALGLTGMVGVRGVQLLSAAWRGNRSIITVPIEGGAPLALTESQLNTLEVLPDGQASPWRIRIRSRLWVGHRGPLHLEGEGALRALQRVMPLINGGGGNRKRVEEAVSLLEPNTSVDDRLRTMTGHPPQTWYHRYINRSQPYLSQHPLPHRLALEMLLREGLEERSMKGELWLLEREWKAAEEIAAIADNLLLPDTIEQRLADASHEARRSRTQAGDING